MIDLGVIRTALFVPGNRPDRVDKAVTLAADAIIIDLEDSVPFAQKEEARARAFEKLLQYGGIKKVVVRVNSLGSGFFRNDLDRLVAKGLFCLMVPKVENAEDVEAISQQLSDVEREKGIKIGSIPVMPQIESAKGVQNIFKIVSRRSDPERVFTAAFGAADYTLDLGIKMTKAGVELYYARSRIPVACRAAEVAPPIDSPFMLDLKDLEALKAEALFAKQMGFQGKLCIHPSQIEPCNTVFSPDPDEIEYAKKVIEAYEEAEAKGLGVIQLEGKMIDYPIVERSRRMLKLAALF